LGGFASARRRDRPPPSAGYKGERIDLTPKKFDFLAYLARYVGKVCTRRTIVGYRLAIDAA